MGGRAAEELFIGEDKVTTGCSSDLQRATNMAYAYIRDLGMLDKEIFINQEARNMSQEYRYKVDKISQNYLKESLSRTKELLQKNKKVFDVMVEKLVEKETLSADEL